MQVDIISVTCRQRTKCDFWCWPLWFVCGNSILGRLQLIRLILTIQCTRKLNLDGLSLEQREREFANEWNWTLGLTDKLIGMIKPEHTQMDQRGMPLRHPWSTCRGKCFQFEYRKPHANSLTESNVYTHNTKHTRNYLLRQLGLRSRNAIQLHTRTVTVCSKACECEYERGFCRLLHFPHEWVETFVRAMHTHRHTWLSSLSA